MPATAAGTENIDRVREFNESVFNGRDYDRIDDFQTDDFVQYGPMTGMELHGSEESVENLRRFHEAFSDLEATEELAFSDGEYVCTIYTYTGTHDGELMGVAPTDESAEVSGIVVNRIEDGKVAEAWVIVDFVGLFQQLGLVPSIDELAA